MGDAAGLLAGARLMGLLGAGQGTWVAVKTADADTEALIDALLGARKAAREGRNFAKADALRDAIVQAGVIIKDSAHAVEWSLADDFDPLKLPKL